MQTADGQYTIDYANTVHGTFEAAHRQLQLGTARCTSWHGHSWRWSVTVSGTSLHNGILLDFGVLKRAVHDWVDEHLDHATLIAADDPMVGHFLADGPTKVFRFGAADPTPSEKLAADLFWPSSEQVGLLLLRLVHDVVLPDACPDAPVAVSEIRVGETSRNEACIRQAVVGRR